MGLVGKFVFHSGPEHYQYGEIIEEPTDGYVLIRLDSSKSLADIGTRSILVPIDTMATELNDEDSLGFICWEFFASCEALNAYVAWLETPDDKSAPKVVALVQKR